MLKPRLVNSCLKAFLNPLKPFSVHYGAIIGLQASGGKEVVRVGIMPNLKEYSKLLHEAIEQDLPTKADAEMVLGAIVGVLGGLEEEGVALVNGYSSGNVEELREKLDEKVGELIGERVIGLGRPRLVQAILEVR